MAASQSRSWRSALIFFALAMGIMVVMALSVALSPPLTVSDQIGDTTITLTAARAMVLSPGTCINLRWEAYNIRELYLNGEGRPGVGDESVCISELASPRFDIVLPDGSNHQYSVNVGVLAASPLAWLGVTLAVFFVINGLYIAFTAAFRRVIARLAVPVWAAGRIALKVLPGLLITLLVLEFGLRTYLSTSGSELDRARYLWTVEQIEANSQLLMEMPFLIYGTGPRDSNLLGYRGKLVDIPKPAGVYRIVTIGGSTTFGIGMGWEDAYPAQLETMLHEQYGYDTVEVVNAGVMGYTTWNSLVNLEFRILELDPDMLIIYHATNDAFTRNLSSECYARLDRYRGLLPNGGVWRQNRPDLGPSALYRFIAIHLGWMDDPTELGTQFDAIPCKVQTTQDSMTLMNLNPPIYFERNIRSMIAIAQDHGVDVLLSTWVYLEDDDVQTRPEWWRYAIGEHNAVVSRLAETYDTLYFDLVGAFPFDPSLWQADGAHLTPDGTRIQAQFYADYLAKQGVLD